MFKKIVWATDGSDSADKALAVAKMLATESGGELVAVHCEELTLPGKGGGSLPVAANEDDLRAKIERQVSDLSADGITATLETHARQGRRSGTRDCQRRARTRERRDRRRDTRAHSARGPTRRKRDPAAASHRPVPVDRGADARSRRARLIGANMTRSGPEAYPADREAEIVLRDGSTVHVRPVRAEDKAAIRTFLEGVSADSIAFRFFGTVNLSWVTEWAVDVDYADRFALVVETGSPRRIIAHAAYIRLGSQSGAQPAQGVASGTAEVAFLVADAWQRKGISTILLAHLAAVAEQHGIDAFCAEVLPATTG